MRTSEIEVRIDNVVLSWDGITNPKQPTTIDAKVSHNVSVLIALTALEIPDLNAIAADKLQSGQFKGTMPVNGYHPVTGQLAQPKKPQPEKFGPEYSNHIAITASTTRGVPPILDINGAQLDIIRAGPMLYPGCIVSILVTCWEYNNLSKGIAFGLQAIQIMDATAPRLPVAAGMTHEAAAAAFSAQSTPVPAANMVAPGAAPKVMTAKAAGATYEAMVAGGWTDEAMIAQGYLTAPVPVAPAAAVPVPVTPVPVAPAAAVPVPVTPVPVAAVPVANAVAPGVAPAPEFNEGPPLRVMTAKAGVVPYESFIAKGWTDEKLIASGYLQP